MAEDWRVTATTPRPTRRTGTVLSFVHDTRARTVLHEAFFSVSQGGKSRKASRNDSFSSAAGIGGMRRGKGGREG